MSVPQASLTFPEGHSVKSLDFPVGLFINNEFVAGEGGKTIEVKAPSTGKTIAHVAEGSANDVDRAVYVVVPPQSDAALVRSWVPPRRNDPALTLSPLFRSFLAARRPRRLTTPSGASAAPVTSAASSS